MNELWPPLLPKKLENTVSHNKFSDKSNFLTKGELKLVPLTYTPLLSTCISDTVIKSLFSLNISQTKEEISLGKI